MIQIQSIRQEGTPSSGTLLFVDLRDDAGNETCVELDTKTGQVVLDQEELKESARKVREFFHALAVAFRHFQEHGPTPADWTPIVVEP